MSTDSVLDSYFMLNDVPGARWFLARVDEVVCCEPMRVNRDSPSGHLKDKWLLDLTQFRQLFDPRRELLPTIFDDQVAMPWKGSALLIGHG
jgi:hypothetical protein